MQAHRTLILRRLKGLEDIISYSAVHWHLGDKGWRFATADEKEPGENVVPDSIPGHEKFTHLRDVYFESEKDFDGRYTVPVLYDKKTNRIVSNESAEIVRMFETEVCCSPLPSKPPSHSLMPWMGMLSGGDSLTISSKKSTAPSTCTQIVSSHRSMR